MVLAAANGEEALKLLEDVRPDLILLDKLMPVMDGTTFASAYRQRADPVPIVAFCAARDAADWSASIGAVGYLGKPFDVEQLAAIVGEHIAKSDRRAAGRP